MAGASPHHEADLVHAGCPTGKLSHATRRGAKAQAYSLKQDTGEHLRPYQCEACDLWHVGHLPSQVLRGRKTADQIYGRRRLPNHVDVPGRTRATDAAAHDRDVP